MLTSPFYWLAVQLDALSLSYTFNHPTPQLLTDLSLIQELYPRQLSAEHLSSRLPVLTGEAQAARNIDINSIGLHKKDKHLQQSQQSYGSAAALAH
jgi:hypothetical protein